MADLPHSPRSFEENLTVYWGVKAGCMSASSQAPLPPSKTCPSYVHASYGFARFHLITIIAVLVFLGVAFEMVLAAWHKD